jgi:hypothetical protein
MFGPYDYNSHPLMPPVVHEKPGQRASWDPHGKQGWYIGPAMEHYRCHCCHVNATNAKRISETVEFFHHTDPIPAIMAHEATIIAAEAPNKAFCQKSKPTNLQELLEPTTLTLSKLQQFVQQQPSVEAQKQASPRVPTLLRMPRAERVQEQHEEATAEQPIVQRTRNAHNRPLPEFFSQTQ